MGEHGLISITEAYGTDNAQTFEVHWEGDRPVRVTLPDGRTVGDGGAGLLLAESKRVCSSEFMESYADYDNYNGPAAWAIIGGSLQEAYGYGNSCAARLSCALNGSGHSIPYVPDASNRNIGGDHDGVRFIISARQLRRYVRQVWGAPDSSFTNSANPFSQLRPGQVAIILSDSHAAALQEFGGSANSRYTDPHVETFGGDVYILDDC